MKKFTIEYIRSEFEKEGYTLLSEEYTDYRKKLEYSCPKGHQHNISWHEWNSLGNRCPYCSRKIKKTIEEIKESFEKEEYILLTTEYKNSSTYLHYICPEGHKHSIRRYNWSSGKMVVHHINYIKKDCSPQNLITVCNTCNLIANHNRNWHTSWYRALLYKRYNYKY
jgi:hypothetical protein